jgi:hypothetical protein
LIRLGDSFIVPYRHGLQEELNLFLIFFLARGLHVANIVPINHAKMSGSRAHANLSCLRLPICQVGEKFTLNAPFFLKLAC